MKLENVKKIYIKDNEEIIIFNNLNIEFKKGKVYLIIGESGSGKTTLINMLGLLDIPTQGKYLIDKEIIENLNDRELAKIRKNKIGMIFQNHYLNPRLTANENVLLPLFLNNYNSSERNKIVNDLFKEFNLLDRMNHYPKELSGGEQQRVCIIRALVNNPDYILADEPTGNLDTNNAIKIYEILKELSQKNKCVIIVSHDKNSYKYADEIYEIKNKKLVKVGENHAKK